MTPFLPLAPSSYFVTVTITGPGAPHAPADHEYTIPSELADHLAEAAEGTPRLSLLYHLEEYMVYQADRLAVDKTFTQTWFDPLVESQEAAPGNHMSYTCDKTLGSPHAVDCENVLHSQLGYPNDIVTLNLGVGRTILSSEFPVLL